MRPISGRGARHFFGPRPLRYNEAPGLIAILIIILSTETRPLPTCSLPCSKIGIIASDGLYSLSMVAADAVFFVRLRQSFSLFKCIYFYVGPYVVGYGSSSFSFFPEQLIVRYFFHYIAFLVSYSTF